MAKCHDWLSWPHGNWNKQLPLTAIALLTRLTERGREGGRDEGGVLKLGLRLAQGYGWLVKMQGFLENGQAWVFFLCRQSQIQIQSESIDKLIFAFKLKIYICAMIEAPQSTCHTMPHCGHSGVIHIKYRIFLISSTFPYCVLWWGRKFVSCFVSSTDNWTSLHSLDIRH